MRLDQQPLLLDENIHPDVADYLRSRGMDVTTVYDLNLTGAGDLLLLQKAHETGRIIITHDGDFGTLAVATGEPLTGIIFLRPGHINPQFTIATLKAILAQDLNIDGPFILVAERQHQTVKIRIRQIN